MSINQYEKLDDTSYFKYTFKSILDKSLHTLEGIIQGIAIDNVINSEEIGELRAWCDDYRHVANRHPFNELIPLIERSISDNNLDPEEKEDIIWLCQNLRTENTYFDVVASDIQRLEGILHGILADNVITEDELINLREWINDNEHLKGIYPYDEIESLIMSVMKDGRIDDDEQKLLKVFFNEFISLPTATNVDKASILQYKREITVPGICVVCPDISFDRKKFCFTGFSTKGGRSEIATIIENKGGIYHDRVTKDTNYLIVGGNGNMCWAFSCYGRKVEQAINYRKKGLNVLIVHESDLWDALRP